ncbi:peptidoglycan DD-metalloendopeptidase family protein [Streptomyces sp. NPDC007264]|uniref:M23 family metallopeptidase n=1 Tax=Streptomyces sp. NPDC007264 TaxID=3364777 RepID=UPI0036DA85B0
MPAKGKHRRPKPRRLMRSMAFVGTGGAALALPLLGATDAHAAAPAATVSGKAVAAAPVAKKAAVKAVAVKTYTVKPGDCLSAIAADQHVAGGWKKLYQDNRTVIGSDPSLIHPGQKLALGAAAAAPSPAKAQTSAATTTAAPKAATAATGYSMPVLGVAIGTKYHVAGSMWSSGYHTGIDFAVPTGSSLKAVGAGTVASAGWGGAYGNQVVVRLADGYYAQYAHLSKLSVSAGQTVAGGQQVGLSGATGNVTGPHLHFEIRTTPNYGSDVDPVAYLRSHGVSIG